MAVHALSITLAAVFNLWYCKKYNIKRSAAFLITIISNILAYVWMLFYTWMLAGFDDFGTRNSIKVLIFVPLLIFPLSKLFKVGWKETCDFLAQGSLWIVSGIGRVACIFPGCGAGYPSTWGIYNGRYRALAFPSQLFEAATVLAIGVLLIWRARQQGYRSDGLSFPLFFMLFGFTSFVWEFTRNNEKLWLGCSELSFHALFMALVGIVSYVLIKRRQSAATGAAIETV